MLDALADSQPAQLGEISRSLTAQLTTYGPEGAAECGQGTGRAQHRGETIVAEVHRAERVGVVGRLAVGAARWSAVAAIMLGLAGIADLVRWGNRWYNAEAFARNAGTSEGVSWEFVYDLLHAAHEALVRGLVLLLLAAALTAITMVIRRRVGR